MTYATLPRRAALILGGASSLALAGRTARAADPIRIGILGTFSGPLATPSLQSQKGVEFAVEQFNRAGGLGGRMAELVVRDTNGEPTKAVNFAQQLINSEKVAAVIGPSNSGEALATVPIVARAGVVNIVQGVLDVLIDPAKYPRAFRASNTNTQWIERANDYVLNVLGKRKVAVFADTSGYGASTAKQVGQLLEKAGAPQVYTVLIDPAKTDVTDEIGKARAAGAEVVSLWTGATGLVARLLNTRGEQGWNVPFIGHPAIAALPVRELLAKPEYWGNAYAVGFTNTTYDAQGKLPPRTQALLDQMRPLLGGAELQFTFWWITLGYDSVNMLLQAMKRAGSTDPAAIAAAMEAAPYEGAYTTYRFMPSEHNGFPDAGLKINLADSFRDGSFTAAPMAPATAR